MPPKTNKQREKLEQNQASSRAKAHDLLRSSAAAPTGFIGFSNFAKPTSSGGSASAAAANPFAAFSAGNSGSGRSLHAYTGEEYASPGGNTAASAMYDGSDHDIAMTLKMLSKKGTVTKTKALNAFLVDIIPHKSPPEIRAMVGHFVQLYTFEVRDQKDRKVRQLLNEVLLAMATKLKPKAFVPHLRRLLPYWLMAMHDPNPDAGAAARKALEALFPENPDMQAEVVATHLSAVMEEYTLFFQHNADTFPGVTLAESDEREERYERCVAAAVLSIDSIIHRFATTNNIAKLNNEDAQFTVYGVVSSDKFGRLVAATSKNPNFTRDAIRKATYTALKSLVSLAYPLVQLREEYFAKLILGAISDKYPANQAELWDMVLTFLQAAAPTLWSRGDSTSIAKFIKSAVLPRLFAQVRHGFYGSARSSFPVLLPLLSLIPLEHVADFNNASCALFSGVIENAWKFVASTDGRYHEEIVIKSVFECLRAFHDYFLRSPSNRDAAERLFGVDKSGDEVTIDHERVALYVNQFEKSTKDSLTAMLTSSKLSVRHVKTYAVEFKSMQSKLRTATDPVSSIVARQFIDACNAWFAQVLETLPSNPAADSSHVGALLEGVVDRQEDAASTENLLSTGKQLYESCLAKLTTADSAPRALELMNVLYDVFGADVVQISVSDGESFTHHFDTHVRPLLKEAGAGALPDGNWDTTTVSTVLRAARQFYLLVEDKKAFVLQLFRDFDVQYGDMRKAVLVVENCFRVPFSVDGAAQWLASGSFHRTQEVDVSTSEHALSAVWKGKLLDEFVMISLKGRLDDLDGEAFSAVLRACLGGDRDMPVVSPDVVVILSHFVTQQSDSDVAMRVIPSLVGLFSRLSLRGDVGTPTELDTAEEQLYLTLLHLAAKSNFKVEAEALWKNHARPAVTTKWTSARRVAFIDSLASTVNSVFAEELKTGAGHYNGRIWAMYFARYLDLATPDDEVHRGFSEFALINRLSLFDLRFEGTRAKLTSLYDRLLSSLAELCDDEASMPRLVRYFEELLAQDSSRGIKLLRRLVDIDLCHGLTFAMLQSDSMATLASDSHVSPLEYISLRSLYVNLAAHVPTLLKTIRDKQQDFGQARYRKVLFLNQHSEADEGTEDVDSLPDLASEDHARLDRLLTVLLVSLLNPQDAVKEAIEWLEQPKNATVSMDHIFRVLVETSDDLSARAQDMVAKSGEILPQWPSPSGVQALRVITTAWMLKATNSFDAAVHSAVLLKLSRTFGSLSQTTLDEWVEASTYLAGLPTAWSPAEDIEETKKRWSLAAQGMLIHALSGKPDLAQVAALNVDKRVLPIVIDDQDAEQMIAQYSCQLVRSRRVVAQLLNSMAHVDGGASLLELTVHQQDALLATLLVGVAEGLAIRLRALPTYLEVTSASQSLSVIQLTAEVDAFLDEATQAIPVVIGVLNDVGRVKGVLLESFGQAKGLAACFNTNKTTTPAHVRAVLYTVCTYTSVFKSSASDGIDINADDEAATERALAKTMIPAGLRAALKANFGSETKTTGQSASKKSRRRQQHAAEDEGVVGRLLVWDLFIQLFPDSGSRDGGHLGMRSTALSTYVAKNGLLSNYLTLCGELLHRETGNQSLVAKLNLEDEPLYSLKDLEDVDQEWVGEVTAVSLAARSFFRTVLRLPAMVRTWWNDECSRSLRSWASKYFEEHITPYVLTSELDIITKASAKRTWDADEMTVKGSKVSREITTTYLKDECALEMVIRVPSSYPLRSVEVECTRRIGITEDRWRRWVLQIIKVTSAQDGSLLDAVLLWKQNVDREFEGVEPCPICYSILNPKTMGLPNLSCKTCSNKYHNSCLYKWFNQSGKNKCPICQQPFT